MDTAENKNKNDVNERVPLKELSEKAEKASKLLWSESEGEDAVIQLAQAEKEIKEFFHSLSHVGHTNTASNIAVNSLVAEMEEMREIVDKRQTGCINCIQGRIICSGPLGRKCNHCSRNRKKCSRNAGKRRKRADAPIIVEDAYIENTANTPSYLTSEVVKLEVMEEVCKLDLQSSIADATKKSIKEERERQLKAPRKSAISNTGDRVSNSAAKAQIAGSANSKRIRWLDLEGGASPTKIAEVLPKKEEIVTIPKKVFDDFRDAFLHMRDAVEDFRRAMRVIEQHGQTQPQ